MEEKKIEQEAGEEQIAAIINEDNLLVQSPRSRSFKEREIFYNTFSFLIKLVNISNFLTKKFSGSDINGFNTSRI